MNFPTVTSPVIQATGSRIVLTWIMAPPVLLLHALRGTYGYSLVSKSAGSVHRQVGGPFSTCAVVGDLFKGRCLTRVNAEEFVRELLGTATARAFNMRGAAARGGNDSSHSLQLTAKMSVGATIPRVGVRVGAFGAHPPISTQTRDTRLQCDRTFLVRTGRERVLRIPAARLTGRGRG